MSTTTTTTQPILVIGAGELGTAVLSALAAAHPKRDTVTTHSSRPLLLSVLLRPSTIASSDATKRASNAHLRSLGRGGGGGGATTLVPGDVASDSEEALAAIFARFHTVVVCAGMGAGFPPGTQLKIARAAVLRAEVKRFVPWQWGIDYDVVGQGSAQDLFDEQLAVRSLLRSEDARATSWVIVSVGLFMSFLFHPGFGVVDLKGRVVRALGSWQTRVTVTDVRDIARVAAEVVWDPRGEETRSRVVFAAGDTVTYGEVADLVERRFGGVEEGGWRREEWSLDVLGKRLRENPDDGMAKYQNVFGAGRGVAWDQDVTINHRRGLEMTTVEKYLAQMEDIES